MPNQVSEELMDPDAFLRLELEPLVDTCWDILSLDEAFPMYSIWSVGMPLPGQNFIAEAERRSGETMPKGFLKNRVKTGTRFEEWLVALYRIALYKHGFQMRFSSNNNPVARCASMAVGHKWGFESDPPNPTGPVSSRIYICGKHPGWEDITNGRNFSGPTSQELIRAFDELGVGEDERAEMFVSNVMRFPNLDAKKSNVMPTLWVKDCAFLLQNELRLVRPDYLLLLGDDATKCLLGRQHNTASSSGKMFELIIPIHEFEDETPKFHTIKVMAICHPARVSRQPDLFPMLVSGLRLFVDLTKGKDIGKKEEDVNIIEAYSEDVLSAWADLMIEENITEFSLDAEWHGQSVLEPGSYLRTIQAAWSTKDVIVVVVQDEKGTPFEGDWKTHLNRVLKHSEGRKIRISGHNFRSDLSWLVPNGLDLRDEFEVPDHRDGTPGWELIKTEGGFDTMLAVHSWQETFGFGLEVCTSQLLGMPRYEFELEDWKVEKCKQLGIKKTDLRGYGEVPDKILHRYAGLDSIGTYRLYELFSKGPDCKLEKDKYGNLSWKPFWIAMRASKVFFEAEQTGILVNKTRAEELIDIYSSVKSKKLQELKDALNWPEFNPCSVRHRTEFLFGESYHPTKVRIRPRGAKSLYLTPIKTTGKRAILWSEVEKKEKYGCEVEGKDPGHYKSFFSPSTDKETFSVIATDLDPKNDPVRMLRNINIISHVLRSVLKPPRMTEVQTIKQYEDPIEALSEIGEEPEFVTEEIAELDENGNKQYDKGLLSFLDPDNRVRTHFFQVLETARTSSSRPSLMNLSKRREPDYERILGSDYKYALRSILTAPEGYALVEADFQSAELACTAWMSNDKNLIEHVRRACLHESHPDYYDILANITVKAFQLNCEPTKKGLKSIGQLALRTAGKQTIYGWIYSMQAELAARKIREEGINVTSQQAQMIIDSLVDTYPGVVEFFKGARKRVREFGWLQNCYGRSRRFSPTTDRQVMGDLERQGANFPIQSMVADSISIAMDNLYKYRIGKNLHYKIILQIHDALLLQVPVSEVEETYDVVLPLCMSKQVPILPTTLGGDRICGVDKPYYFGISRDVYKNWGEELTESECRIHKIPERFAKG